jgi:VWFA-related protein
MKHSSSTRPHRTHFKSFLRAIRAAFAAALCVVFSTSPAALREQTQSSGESIKATSVAVNVYAIAEGRHGELIQGLHRDDFELSDEGTPQKIAYFSSETNAGVSLGIAIDTSLSQSHLLNTEQEAAKRFLRSVLQSGDQAFVMSFDVDVKLLKDFTGVATDLVRDRFCGSGSRLRMTAASLGPRTGRTTPTRTLASRELIGPKRARSG